MEIQRERETVYIVFWGEEKNDFKRLMLCFALSKNNRGKPIKLKHVFKLCSAWANFLSPTSNSAFLHEK